MAKASRDKGARGEREVAALFMARGFTAGRTPNSGGLHIPGDIAVADGLHIEVKRCETLRVPSWIRQAHAEAPDAAIPLVAFRTNNARAGDPLGAWNAILPLTDLIRLLEIARDTEARP